jgi:hypothetical protein
VGLLTPDEYGGGSRDASHTIEPFEARNLEAMREEAYWGELEGEPA